MTIDGMFMDAGAELVSDIKGPSTDVIRKGPAPAREASISPRTASLWPGGAWPCHCPGVCAGRTVTISSYQSASACMNLAVSVRKCSAQFVGRPNDQNSA